MRSECEINDDYDDDVDLSKHYYFNIYSYKNYYTLLCFLFAFSKLLLAGMSLFGKLVIFYFSLHLFCFFLFYFTKKQLL